MAAAHRLELDLIIGDGFLNQFAIRIRFDNWRWIPEPICKFVGDFSAYTYLVLVPGRTFSMLVPLLSQIC